MIQWDDDRRRLSISSYLPPQALPVKTPRRGGSTHAAARHQSERGRVAAILDEFSDRLEDRTQSEVGRLDNRVCYLDRKMKAVRGIDLDTRKHKWNTLGDAKGHRFKKFYNPKTQLDILWMKEGVELAFSHFTKKADEKFGFPLEEFSESKYDHDLTIERKRDEDRVDYSVDEIDMKWLIIMNTLMFNTKGGLIYSVVVLEHWFDRMEKLCVWKPKEVKKMIDEHGNTIDDVCNICLDGDHSNCNQIVYCDRCNLPVHQECYGVPFIPEGALECRRCMVSPARLVHCVLCPSTAGAMKQMDNKQWVHVLCVIWLDETHFGNVIFMENVQNVEKAINDRKALKCSLCPAKHARKGACIQCSEARCTVSFHVTCARNAGLIMRIVEAEGGTVDRFVWCPKHAPAMTAADIQQQKNRVQNQRRENQRELAVATKPQLSTEIIAQIQAESPFRDHRELIYYWCLKRADRLGAPLLKNIHHQLAIEGSSDSSRNRRGGRGNNAPIDYEAMSKQLPVVKKWLAQSVKMFEMVERREEHKLDLINYPIQILQQGFKPTKNHIIEVIEHLKKSDDGTFAAPVVLAGYLDIVQNPISLQDITEKAAAGEYANISDLSADIKLMLDNCFLFNKGNSYYMGVGRKYQRVAKKILDTATLFEANQNAFKTEEDFMEALLNALMVDYMGPKGAEQLATPSNTTLRTHGRLPEVKIEMVDGETPTTSKKSARKRAVPEDSEPSTSTPAIQATPTFATPTSAATPTSGSRGRKSEDHKIALASPTMSTPLPPRKRTQVAQSMAPPPPPSALRQTTLTSFFGATPKQQWEQKAKEVHHVTFAVEPEKQTHVMFGGPSTSTPSTSGFTNPFMPSTSSSTRPATRSTSVASSTTVTPRSSRFRASSSAIQSPLPVTTKVGKHAMEEEEMDEEAEIQLQPPPVEMTPEQIRKEKLKSAENEAMSKFAHNQLVVVDGKAAKVIDLRMAQLDIEREQRQNMLKKREVLSEIPRESLIYVQFFQKSNSYENGQWVTPDRVELLDLASASQRSPKILGLRAAREWHQQVINGTGK